MPIRSAATTTTTSSGALTVRVVGAAFGMFVACKHSANTPDRNEPKRRGRVREQNQLRCRQIAHSPEPPRNPQAPLKIVVSPVRVRDSPSSKGAGNRLFLRAREDLLDKIERRPTPDVRLDAAPL